MKEVFITNEFLKNRAMGFEVSIINSQNSFIKGLEVGTIDVTSSTKHMVRAGSTFNSKIQPRAAITG